MQHNLRFDLDGNLLDSIRQLALDPTTPPDWISLQSVTDPARALALAAPSLEGETFTVESRYDALGRLVSQHQPDGSEMRYSYHESSLLQRLEARVPGAPGWTDIVADTEYNAKGQRTRARFGQGVLTSYTYDEQTFRIRRMFSARPVGKVTLQDLHFTYDPVGNIVEQRDEAQQDVYFGNAVASAKGLYEYDALYRLVEAEGREHPGQQPSDADLPWSSLPHPNVTNALIRYTERYSYDEVGNILQMQHLAGAGGWTRRYQYETRSGGAPASNRLLATSLPGDPTGGPYSARYSYDASGNMTSMPHLQGMNWDWASRLQHVSKGGGGDVYLSYAPDGQRVRKVYLHGNIRDERIYLGGYELFRRRSSGTLETERHTLHLQDGDKRLAMAETLTVDHGKEIKAPSARMRFQLPNHLDSVCVETDENGAVITYEEYHPYGTTAFRAEAPGADVSAKRYRYTGMERDEETSLAYHTARYYAPWLARWTSPDPLEFTDSLNLFCYCKSNPLSLNDPAGTTSQADEEFAPEEAQSTSNFEEPIPHSPTSPFVSNSSTREIMELLQESDTGKFLLEWLERNLDRKVYIHLNKGLGENFENDPRAGLTEVLSSGYKQPIFVSIDPYLIESAGVQQGFSSSEEIMALMAGFIAHEIYHTAQIMGLDLREGIKSGDSETPSEQLELERSPRAIFNLVATELLQKLRNK